MEPARAPRPQRLFVQVLASFVLTLIGAVTLAVVLSFKLAGAYGPKWVDQVTGEFELARPTLERASNPVDLEAAAAEIAARFDAHARIDSRPRSFIKARRQMHVGAIRRLRRGRLVVLPPRSPLEYPKVVIPLLSEQTERLSAIIVVEPNRPRSILIIISIIGGFGVVIAGAWMLSRSLTQRIIKLEGVARRLAGGDLSARAGALGSSNPTRADEIDALASTFDDMATRIDHLVRSQKTLLTNVSHELRTPLARMRVLSELMTDRMETDDLAARHKDVERLEEDVGEMERLVRDLLTSGRLDLGGSSALESIPCDLRELSGRCAERVGGRCDLPDRPALVLGDPLLLERLLSNLLGNARRSAGEGEVSLQIRRGDDELILEVIDDGAGILPEHRETIFDPFVRLDEARARDAGGTGLGLFLCRQIVEAHGGSISATDRPDGARGACIEIKLPSARDAAAPDSADV